jgi:D-3-phosphoglycerate dehydrogenase
VALQVAEQMSDYLLTGAITNAINMPSITADQAVVMKPWISLAEKLGAFAGQLTETSIKSVEIVFEGNVAELNTRALTQAALAGLLKPNLSEVNMVNAPIVAKERGIQVSEIRRTQHGAYEGYLMLKVTTEKQTREVAGTVFSNGVPRLIQVKGIDMESHFTPHMLYVTNEDKPGFIGRLGTLLGDSKVNIASFNLGRTGPGGDAIALVEVDAPVPETVLAELRKLPVVKQAKALVF